jgi:hypothetical protein
LRIRYVPQREIGFHHYFQRHFKQILSAAKPTMPGIPLIARFLAGASLAGEIAASEEERENRSTGCGSSIDSACAGSFVVSDGMLWG